MSVTSIGAFLGKDGVLARLFSIILELLPGEELAVQLGNEGATKRRNAGNKLRRQLRITVTSVFSSLLCVVSTTNVVDRHPSKQALIVGSWLSRRPCRFGEHRQQSLWRLILADKRISPGNNNDRPPG